MGGEGGVGPGDHGGVVYADGLTGVGFHLEGGAGDRAGGGLVGDGDVGGGGLRVLDQDVGGEAKAGAPFGQVVVGSGGGGAPGVVSLSSVVAVHGALRDHRDVGDHLDGSVLGPDLVGHVESRAGVRRVRSHWLVAGAWPLDHPGNGAVGSGIVGVLDEQPALKSPVRGTFRHVPGGGGGGHPGGAVGLGAGGVRYRSSTWSDPR